MFDDVGSNVEYAGVLIVGVARLVDEEMNEGLGGVEVGMETREAVRVTVDARSSSLRLETPIGVKALLSLFFNL